MSLFHYQEWFDGIYKDAITVAVGDFFDFRDQIIIGTLQGIIAILDPGKDIDNRYETSSLIEQQLNQPVIQILVGKFLSNYEADIIAVLHPKELKYYRLVKDSNGICQIELLFTHKIKGQPAYNMCCGYFGKSEKERLCVQTINCTLHFFESENHLLTKEAYQQIHPGPIIYNEVSESIITSCGGILMSTKFSLMASTISNNKNDKSIADWELNLGDTPVELKCVSTLPAQPSILILCRRSLHCLTTGGALRYTIRLENPAMAMHVQTKGSIISTILATHMKTLLFYHDTTQVWSAQLTFIPILIKLVTFNETLRNMVLMLSDENRLSIGYLGSEPSLFRMPVSDSRYIDFEKRKEELKQYEEQILLNTKNSIDDIQTNNVKIEVDIKVDTISNAIDSEEGVPSATLKIIVTGSYNKLDVFIQNELSVFQIGNEPIYENDGTFIKAIYMYNMFAEKSIYDHRMTIIVLTDNRDTYYHHCNVPLNLIFEKVASQKMATHKFTLDSTENCLSIQQLFPEYESDNPLGIGFRSYYSKDIASVFISQKTNKYRIQSDNPSICYIIINEISNKIKKLQPNATVKTTSVPMQLFLKPIAEYLEVEKEREIVEEDVKRLAIQMRHVEMILLQKLKNEHESPASHINVLINYSYHELLSAFEKLQELEDKTSSQGQKTLKSYLNLMNLLLQLADVELPFDGTILDGTFQKLAERINILIPSSTAYLSSTPEPIEIVRMIVNYCESGGKLSSIAEIEEEDEEIEEPEEFVELKSGTVPVNLDNNDS